MGDVLSLVERAAEAVDAEDAKRMEEKDAQGTVYPRGFSGAIAADEKDRFAESIVEMLPGGSEMLKSPTWANRRGNFDGWKE